MTNIETEVIDPLIALVGPTGVGKTSLSLALAEHFEIEIVSADSRLFYRGLDIGTAKPTARERQRVPHHLIDVTDPAHPWSLADFHREAHLAIRSIHQRGRLPILVGGTGQYVTAIVEGWQPPARARTDEYRKELEQYAASQGAAALHSRLAEVDAVSAGKIDYRNVRRVIRALEIFKVTGQPPSLIRSKSKPPYRVLFIGLMLPRAQLYVRIDDRFESMISAGWEDEVRRLLDEGYDFKSPPFSAIGYRQLARYVTSEGTFEQVRQEVRRLSRQFVRRQANWFKADDPRIHWFTQRDGVLAEIKALIEGWLNPERSQG